MQQNKVGKRTKCKTKNGKEIKLTRSEIKITYIFN